jgi:cobalamin biosynthetic protein CobC
MPDASVVNLTEQRGVVVLKGLGKFWGLAGMRLGFAIARPDTIAALRDRLGPWAVSGPALHVGATALQDHDWAAATRQRLRQASAKLDGIATDTGLSLVGGTDLFRLYACSNSDTVYRKLAAEHILTRTFPYSKTWIRLGLPGDEAEWQRLSRVLGE